LLPSGAFLIGSVAQACPLLRLSGPLEYCPHRPSDERRHRLPPQALLSHVCRFLLRLAGELALCARRRRSPLVQVHGDALLYALYLCSDPFLYLFLRAAVTFAPARR